MEEEKKTRITFTKDEVRILAHLTRHFCDYMGGDDRPDHGLGILKQYRESYLDHIHNKPFGEPPPEYIQNLINAMGKLNRRQMKMMQ